MAMCLWLWYPPKMLLFISILLFSYTPNSKYQFVNSVKCFCNTLPCLDNPALNKTCEAEEGTQCYTHIETHELDDGRSEYSFHYGCTFPEAGTSFAFATVHMHLILAM
ncbi:hypothetical protein EB796_001145 [Bugula neritina]|uniref:Uncharacterized protein n=1 Tax=Bugula neritina TaxID=10212 RepID=A0A7J7KQU1_BUGNE|nr:hypothetical protein EB796_001145 [Bugula neritina]